MRESQKRSLAKTLTWRITGSGSTFLVSWFIIGDIILASTILGIHFFLNTFLYFVHERIWDKIIWGKHKLIKKE